MEKSNDPNSRHWLDSSRNITFLVRLMAVICALLIILDFFVERHGYFYAEHWYGFYGIFGFATYCLIVLSAKQLRLLLKRQSDYYER